MSVPVEVPELGESITEAIVAEWVKNVGDFVNEDDVLVELETDKITVSVPAPVSGILKALKAAADDTVNVGDVLAEIEPGDAPAASAPEAAATPAAATTSATTLADGASEATEDSALSPAVRRLIEENAINPRDIKGSGPGGRILKGDVLEAVEAKSKAPAQPAAKTPPPAPVRTEAAASDEPVERVKMSKLRQTVARRLVEAQQTAAMLTTFNEVDMSAVMAMRSQFQDRFVKKYGIKLGFMSFFVKASIAALKEYPAVNAEIDGEDIVYKNYYHIGVAVGGPRGLVVPVVKHADQLGFAEVEQEIARLATKVSESRLALADMQGGTFTISNGGIYGSMLSTPILNPPQVGILGMHNIVQRPMVVDGEIVIRPMMNLALTYDHRIIDGKEAVSFLVRLKECLENPERILLEV